MRYLLPPLLPDELLGGWWIRAVRSAGLPVRSLARYTVGRKWAPGFFQASHLVDLASMLGTSAEQILWDHTVFPYATAFFQQEVFDGAFRSAMSTGLTAVGMGSVTQSVSDTAPYRRFCPACAEEDAKRWGQSYWHRAHNLPGVVVCTDHNVALRTTDLATKGRLSWNEILPHEARFRSSCSSGTRVFNRVLASSSKRLLERPPGQRPNSDPQWYRDELVRLGLLSPGKQISNSNLRLWLGAALGKRPEHFGLTQKDAGLMWASIMLRPRAAHPVIPLKHLLFQTALSVQAPLDRPLLDHVPAGAPKRERLDPADREYAAGVAAVVRNCIRRGERIAIKDALARVGCWSRYRHERARFPQTQAAIAVLRLSTANVRPNWGGQRFRRRQPDDELAE